MLSSLWNNLKADGKSNWTNTDINHTEKKYWLLKNVTLDTLVPPGVLVIRHHRHHLTTMTITTPGITLVLWWYSHRSHRGSKIARLSHIVRYRQQYIYIKVYQRQFSNVIKLDAICSVSVFLIAHNEIYFLPVQTT